ncbi:MAG: MarR family winged helix-turn-helix transcriptional regulator [Phycicoccus sp.]
MKRASQSARALDNTAVLLREAYLVIERVVPVRLAERGHAAVRVAHGAVFRHLDEEGTTVSALAERAGMTKQAMAELVHYLEGHGYLRRVPDPADRRAKLVQPTDVGTEVVAIVLSLVPEMEDRIIAALGESRWRALRNDLRTIRRLFDDLPDPQASTSDPPLHAG